MDTAKQVLGNGRLLNDFVSRLLDDIGNLKAMLRAISIGLHRSQQHPTCCLVWYHSLPNQGPSQARKQEMCSVFNKHS